MKRGFLIGLIGLIGLVGLVGCRQEPTDVQLVKQQPAIYPDYIGVTIPVGIAPLNFDVVGEGIDRVDAQVTGSKGGELRANGDDADFDLEEWHALLEQNKGGEPDGDRLCPQGRQVATVSGL